jgi:hypothetical protein
MSLFNILGREDAIKAITKFIQRRESKSISWDGWYVGITADPNERVYEVHKASRYDSIIVAIESAEAARSVEKYFKEDMGTAGDLGGGMNPRFVYAFKLRPDTDPPLR